LGAAVRAPAPKLLRLSAGVLFILLATANAAGYRYGVSDQAFYIPAVLHALDPQAFPHDARLIVSQARLMMLDEALAAAVGATGLSLPTLFAIGYFLSLALIWAALVLIGETLYVHRWTTAALLAAFTLRHRIMRTSANTFEGYFHPRMLAFGVCALAVAAVLRRRPWIAIALVAIAGFIHSTTALWFAVLIGVALIVADRALRPALLGCAILMAAAAAWTVTAGPLAGSFVVIDHEWRQVLARKDSLFPNEWPLAAWVVNLGTAAALGWAYTLRRRLAAASPEDTGLAAGGAALLALFLVTLPFVAAGVSFFVELQISRVFWLIDLLATVYVIGAVDRLQPAPRVIRSVAMALLAVSLARGVYILHVEHPERSLFSFELETSPWHDAMRWIRAQPAGAHVLADPGHAWKHGTSVRVSGEHDVFHEEAKDSALAIYSRDVAMRVLERGRALGDFTQLTPDHARVLAGRYDLDYLVTTARLELPVSYRNEQFTIYAIGPPPFRSGHGLPENQLPDQPFVRVEMLKRPRPQPGKVVEVVADQIAMVGGPYGGGLTASRRGVERHHAVAPPADSREEHERRQEESRGVEGALAPDASDVEVVHVRAVRALGVEPPRRRF
jgi:hypothetical protein